MTVVNTLLIFRDDWESALKEFENCVEKYKLTPWKNELVKHFIEKEDAISLEKITDLSTKVHGERNSLCDLALLFMECGRSRQAKKILEVRSSFFFCLRARFGHLRFVKF